jgi:hypothetical protein
MLAQDWRIDAALLYSEAPMLDLASLASGINDALSRFRLTFCLTARADDRAVYSNGVVDVIVTRSDRPLPAARFSRALDARFARLRPNDYATPLAAHSHAIGIETRVSPDAGRPVPAETRIVVCHAAIMAVQGLAWPDLIHWRQSDTLFLPDEIPPVEGIGFPAMLVTRPEITAAGSDARGRRRFAVLAGLSDHWFGKPVRVTATSHPLPEVLAVIDFCLIRHLSGDDILAQDGVMALSERTEVVIRHAGPGPGLPKGAIDLSFRNRSLERPAPGPVPMAPQAIPMPAQPIHLADHRSARRHS